MYRIADQNGRCVIEKYVGTVQPGDYEIWNPVALVYKGPMSGKSYPEKEWQNRAATILYALNAVEQMNTDNKTESSGEFSDPVSRDETNPTFGDP